MSGALIQNYKEIFDAIHGFISISNYAARIIDSAPFQRLRRLKQLGTCEYVFPTGIGKRFEHSIGTYHLAGAAMKSIMKTKPDEISSYLQSIPELSNYYERTYGNKHVLDDFVCELVKIGGLCHDLGHGPFSHIFDDIFLPNAKKEPSKYDLHEERSGFILAHIVKNDPLLTKMIHDSDIEFIKTLINPTDKHTGFLYQIVSNTLNGADVDKYDYITRDSYALDQKTGFDFRRLVNNITIVENTICYYPENINQEIIKMFQSRYNLHKQFYCHKLVISAQFMIVEIFKLLDDVLKISESVDNVDNFCELTDDYILNSITFLMKPYCKLTDEQTKNVKKAYEILMRLNTHNFYVFVDTFINDDVIDFSMDDFRQLKTFETKYEDDILFYKTKIGFVSGNKKNPLDSLFTYQPSKKYIEGKKQLVKIDRKHFSCLIPEKHQEFIIMIFYRNRNDVEGKAKITAWFKEIVAAKRR